MVNKVITYLDYYEISGPDCIQELFLNSCELDFSCISVDVFNMGLKWSCSLDWWKVSSVVLVFKNSGKRPEAKNYCCVTPFYVVSKIFGEPVNNSLFDMFIFWISSMLLSLLVLVQVFFWHLYLIDLLALLSGLGLLELWCYIYSMLVMECGNLVFLKSSSLMEFQSGFSLRLSFLGNRQSRVVLNVLQDYPVIVEALQIFILGPMFFL